MKKAQHPNEIEATQDMQPTHRQAELAVAPQPPAGGAPVVPVVEDEHGALARAHDVQEGRVRGVDGPGGGRGQGLLDQDDIPAWWLLVLVLLAAGGVVGWMCGCCVCAHVGLGGA